MRKLFLLITAVFFFATAALAQRTITGKVSDDKGNPVPNASVMVKGTTTGTVTKTDGTYSITVPANARTLIFSSVDMGSTEINIGTQSVVNATLIVEDRTIGEVVVVGYGTQRRKDVTGSVSQVLGGKIKDVPMQSFEQALSGRAAGVNISIPNGVTNNPPVIRVRGTNSISLSSFPLVVIDGVPTFTGNAGGTASNNVLGDINPSDIESIEVLKDASAAAIYGSRAAAGVLLITTKKGKQGRARVNYEGAVGLTNAYGLIPVLDANEYTLLKNEGLVNAGTPANGTSRGFYTMNDANGNLVNTNWYDLTYRQGFSHTHNVNVSGANERTTYYLSTGYTDQEGFIRDNNFKRMTGRFTLDHKVNNWLAVGGTFSYANSTNTTPNTGSLPGAAFNTSGIGRLPLVLAPNVGPYKNDGTYNINNATNSIGQGNNLTALSFTNPQLLIDMNNFSSETDRILGNVFAEFTFAKGLKLRTNYGIDNLLVENKEFRNGIHGDGVQFGGAASNTFQRIERWNFQNILSYDKRFAEKHNLNVLFGTEQQYTRSQGWGADRRTVADPFYDEFQGSFGAIVPAGNFIGENYLNSFFGRINYDYKKRYFVSLNGRRDGYSAFAPGGKWGDFGGFSAGWQVSEETFFKNSNFANVISTLKFRGSHGEVGNNQGIGDYAFYSFYNPGLYGTDPNLAFAQAGNPALSWETSKKNDYGLTIGLFKDRYSFDVTYYKNNIDGLILNVPQAPSLGIPGNTILKNVGSMYNKGIEVTISATILNKRNFNWTSSFNITTVKNKVTALAEGVTEFLVATSGLERPSLVRVGESIGSFLVVKTGGVNPANGRRIFYYKDGTAVQFDLSAPAASRWTFVSDGNPAPRGADQASDGVLIGPALPKYFGGWDNTFRFSGFDVNILIYYSGGNYVYNGTKAGLRDNRNWNSARKQLERWTKPGDVTDIPRIVFGDNISNGSGIVISENVEKGDFVKFRNVSLGYTFPKRILNSLNVSSIRVYMSILNAFTITEYTGFDPEISTNGNANGGPSVDRNSVPQSRTFNFGINVGF